LKDARYVDYIIGRLKCDAVFHAAAYKHVPMMEANPVAAIENNLFGTENLVNACLRHGTSRFVLITTDKAVHPTSVYGASKLLCERLVLDTKAGGAFMAVRFGNVLGSRGSIVPLFQAQIERGGPVTLTDEGMTRYFMTIPEACSLVLKAGGVGENGCLYLLDMGEPIKIRDIAEQMIRFCGYEPDVDIKIKVTGKRPGERVTENLWAENEKPLDTRFPRIRRVVRVRPPQPAFPELTAPNPLDEAGGLGGLMESLRPVCFFDAARPEAYRDAALLRRLLHNAIPSLPPDEQA
jgi:FlaA1/EpsC-like NDP-sugar epimerase